jgi:hypothetical protein
MCGDSIVTVQFCSLLLHDCFADSGLKHWRHLWFRGQNIYVRAGVFFSVSGGDDDVCVCVCVCVTGVAATMGTPPPYTEYAEVIISEGVKIVETAGNNPKVTHGAVCVCVCVCLCVCVFVCCVFVWKYRCCC